jgi:glutamine amidotransferase
MSVRIAVVDYGAGNLFSVQRGIAAAGCTSDFIADPQQFRNADVLLLPGVGAFGAGMDKLRASGMDAAIADFVRTGRPLLGICLGMQLLMSRSFEFGEHAGLDLIPGEVLPIERASGWPVPNIGWCSIDMHRDGSGTPFVDTKTGQDFYFVHSFRCAPANEADVLGSIEYGEARIAAIVSRDNVHGCQFHPEISAQAGLNIYRALASMR